VRVRCHPVRVCQVEAVPGMRGTKSGLCKVRARVATRKPLLLGYMPQLLLEGP
jgi:hypothetical protein